MTRLPGWEARLRAALARFERRGFRWGEADCALFAAECVRAITGEDLAARFRGTYRTRLGAARHLRERGGLRNIATSVLGPPIAPRFAQRGDVVAIATEQGEALAVSLGERLAAMGAAGVVIMPMGRALTAWRV